MKDREERRTIFARRLAENSFLRHDSCLKIFDYLESIEYGDYIEDPLAHDAADYGTVGMYYEEFAWLENIKSSGVKNADYDYFVRNLKDGRVEIPNYGTAFALEFFVNIYGEDDVRGIINMA